MDIIYEDESRRYCLEGDDVMLYEKSSLSDDWAETKRDKAVVYLLKAIIEQVKE